MSQVLAIYTGGTIGMVHAVTGDPSSPLVPVQDEDELLACAPWAAGLRDEVDFDFQPLTEADGNRLPAIDSSNMNITYWRTIADQIEREYDAYDGFVVLHGSDTMAYTASVLSFMLRDLAKPVVVTGSQIPIVNPINDGLWNFGAAVRIAAHWHVGLPLIPEVTVCFGDHLFRGNRARKRSTISHQGFHSPNYQTLGEITAGAGIKLYPERALPPADNSTRPLRGDLRFDPRVVEFSLVPGMSAVPLAAILALDEVQGMVLCTFGSGNAPTDEASNDRTAPGVVRTVHDAVAAGKVIVSVSLCPEAQVQSGRYAAGGALERAGVVSGLDLTPEAALMKLMWLLAAHPGDPERVRAEVQRPIRGELTPLG